MPFPYVAVPLATTDNNKLIINGSFAGTIVEIGPVFGNTDNALTVILVATIDLVTLRIMQGNYLNLEGDYSTFSALEAYLGAGVLEAWSGASWLTVNSANESFLLSSSFDSVTGFTSVTTMVPEPQTYAVFAGTLVLLFALRRRHRRDLPL